MARRNPGYRAIGETLKVYFSLVEHLLRRPVRQLAIVAGVTLVLMPLLAINAANVASAMPSSPYAPPDNVHTIPYIYQGMVYYEDVDGLTATGADIADTALDPTFHPAAKGVSYGPTHAIPNCVQPPAQGGPVDRATYSDEQLAAYGLPTWAEWVGRGNTDRTEWENNVRSAGTRACYYHTRYEDGKGVIGGSLTPATAKASAHSTIAARPDTLRAPNLSFCGYPFSLGNSVWWGWMSDSFGDCPESTYYQYTAMEGYLRVPNWDNFAYANQDAAGWLGRGGWKILNACGQADHRSLVQAGFHMQTITYVEQLATAFWENTGWGADCFENDITTTPSGSNWVEFGGDLLYIILGCGGSPSNNCTYVHIEDQTLGKNTFYFTNYVSGPVPNTQSAACMHELTKDVGFFRTLYYTSADVYFCRASHWQTTNNTVVETGVPMYNAAEIWGDQPGTTLVCVNAGLPNNPGDPTWPNSSFTEYRDTTNNNC